MAILTVFFETYKTYIKVTLSLCRQPTLTVSANYGRNLDLRLLRGRVKLSFQFLCHPIPCLSLFLVVFGPQGRPEASEQEASPQVPIKILPPTDTLAEAGSCILCHLLVPTAGVYLPVTLGHSPQ